MYLSFKITSPYSLSRSVVKGKTVECHISDFFNAATYDKPTSHKLYSSSHPINLEWVNIVIFLRGLCDVLHAIPLWHLNLSLLILDAKRP
jgi:hypothetical protein